MSKYISSVVNSLSASEVLTAWRFQGPIAAQEMLLSKFSADNSLVHDLLHSELSLRLAGHPGPRLLIDGIWFSRPYGGITRVWEQILRAWQLPGLLYSEAPICLIDRDSHLALTDLFQCLDGQHIDPLDPVAVDTISLENASFVRSWGAQVFLSSWISSSGRERPNCSELALVHDCLPERFKVPEPLAGLRQRWLNGARSHLAVSKATAEDLKHFLEYKSNQIHWCHSAPAPIFAETIRHPDAQRIWSQLQRKVGLKDPYLLLPATSAIGSYKKPETVAKALKNPDLEGIQLVLCGIGAQKRCTELEAFAPHLVGRIISAGFTDFELALVYKHAFAVVIPSSIEGFGLPAIEALASEARVFLADSRGLKEAGGAACMRFSATEPNELVELLKLFLEPKTSKNLQPALARRRSERISCLNPDLMGLFLLALARTLM